MIVQWLVLLDLLDHAISTTPRYVIGIIYTSDSRILTSEDWVLKKRFFIKFERLSMCMQC